MLYGFLIPESSAEIGVYGNGCRSLCTERFIICKLDEYDLAIADYKYADSLLSVRYPEDSNSRMHILLAMANCWYHKKDFAVAKKKLFPLFSFV